ncbi:hypothetical protein [Pseudomonas sp. MWU12-2323]|uniref:hypothetical protein n=1 Tax=Pseudomonas sp. MWU12-2323 TaxID=2651296 RepID=UPI00128E0ECE|nr:hypothetical protein [Pseudomonas sp. MWU12-2323]MPQ69256.1 hypothetical protein [Pseudomonas sp. MWU12-2323]
MKYHPTPVPPMNQLETYVAFSIQNGIVHLCLDSKRTQMQKTTSLCREALLGLSRVAVDRDDLGKIQNFIICKGCEARYNLMGYRAFYAPEHQEARTHPAQLPLF